jgi:hypothetical protein
MRSKIAMFVSATFFSLPGVAFADVICDGDVLLGESIDDTVVVEGPCTIQNSTIDGNVIVESSGNLLVVDSTIEGNIQNDTSKRVRVKRSDVNGDIQLTGLTSAKRSEVVGTFVGGTIDFFDNESPIILSKNDVNSDIKANNNFGGVTISNNDVGGNLQCQGNSPAPIGGNNVVDGNKEDQCEDL